MPKPTKGPRLGGGPAHERLLLGNLAAQLFTHKRIQTTETKAKRVQPLAERLITQAKKGDIHNRRKVLETITDKGVVHELFTEIAPLVADREGGYTRIIKTGFRKGDNAPMAVIELVLEPVQPKVKADKPADEAPVVDEAPETAAVDIDETEAPIDAAANDAPDADVDAEATVVDVAEADTEGVDGGEVDAVAEPELNADADSAETEK